MSVLTDQLAEHIEQLRDLEVQLGDLGKAKSSGLMDQTDEFYLLSQVQTHLRQTSKLQQRFARQQASVLNALPAHVALLDSFGNLFEVNDAWQAFAHQNGADDRNSYLGKNYLEVCDSSEGDSSEQGHAAADGLRAILSGQQSNFSMDYPCHAPDQQRWFRLLAAPLRLDGFCGAVVMQIDITGLSAVRDQKAVSGAVAESAG